MAPIISNKPSDVAFVIKKAFDTLREGGTLMTEDKRTHIVMSPPTKHLDDVLVLSDESQSLLNSELTKRTAQLLDDFPGQRVKEIAREVEYQRDRMRGMRPLKVFPVPKSWFSRIEYALDIKLNFGQKKSLFEAELYGGHRSGRTVSWLILVALSIGPPLKMEQITEPGICHSPGMLWNLYRNYGHIVEKLEAAGFDCRQVERVGGWKLK